ncbi:MAG: DUF934 domain-containing protein [Gimesia chilikensis]
MQTLIKNGELATNSWTVLKTATGPEVLQVMPPGRNLIVPLTFWQSYPQELADYNAEIAIWLDSHENVNDIGDKLHDFPLIALNFPVFSDGRSYSNARELREHFNYQGEVRAIGDVLRDQLYYMSRCGFDALEIRHDQDAQACLAALHDFSTNYQATVAEPLPLFRRR